MDFLGCKGQLYSFCGQTVSHVFLCKKKKKKKPHLRDERVHSAVCVCAGRSDLGGGGVSEDPRGLKSWYKVTFDTGTTPPLSLSNTCVFERGGLVRSEQRRPSVPFGPRCRVAEENNLEENGLQCLSLQSFFLPTLRQTTSANGD